MHTLKAMHSIFDLKWFSLDADAAVDLMKAVEKLMFAVHVGWSYRPYPVVSSAEKAAIDTGEGTNIFVAGSKFMRPY